MDKTTQKVYDFIRAKGLLRRGGSVIVGVSGGSDSVCLLSVLHELGRVMDLRLAAVHVNHGLRGAEADHDEHFTQDLCERLGIPCRIFRADVAQIAREQRMTEEEAGRAFRYRCFAQAAQETGADHIAVAHHLDDQSETVLMNLLRGSGPYGMTGIHARRGRVIRPLLCLRKSEIEEYLRRRGLDWCTDRTNYETDHTRNCVRNELMPYLREKINPQADRHIASMAELMEDLMEHVKAEAQKAAEELLTVREEGTLSINAAGFLALDTAMQREVARIALGRAAGRMKDIGMTHVELLRGLFRQGAGSHLDLPYGLAAVREQDAILVSQGKEKLCVKKKTCAQQDTLPVEVKTAQMVPGSRLEIEADQRSFEFYRVYMADLPESLQDREHLPGKDGKMRGKNGFTGHDKKLAIHEKKYTKLLDYDKINDRQLCLRHRREGDYMLLAGGHRKLLKRVFIDDKIPAARRDDILLLADGSHIVWIIDNGRLSEYYKLTERTDSVLVVRLKTEEAGRNHGEG